MSDYKAPVRDMQFVLYELFDMEQRWAGYPQLAGEVNRELADAILNEAAHINESLIAPLSRAGDEEGARWTAEGVKTAAGYQQAFSTVAEGGWLGLAGNTEYGGQGLPKALTTNFDEMLYGADNSFSLFVSLTTGAALAVDAHAETSVKERFLPNLYSGQWAGAMCLTEPHSGTDLGIIRTKAEPQGDGTYTITGTKIFITGGEHDLTENIIHLVLAKLPDAPAGPKGISLFLVPRVWVEDDGSLAGANGVQCGSIESKMGIKASPTCVMNFDGAKGYLVGEENKGLACMFTMMNYERLSIGLQGIGCAEASYQTAATYAKERLQGRNASGAVAPDQVADPIIVHPDVRRMLMTMRAMTEGGRAFAAFVGGCLDDAKFHSNDEVGQQAEQLVALLTPVAKAFFTDRGFDACVDGQQVLGGHGYIREWGQEQKVRDARIAQIYEGTNGIQALDLMGRKVVANGGKFLQTYLKLMEDDIAQLVASELATPELENYVQQTRQAMTLLADTSQQVIAQAQGDAFAIGAASVEYLDLMGYTSYAYMWLKMLATVADKRDGDDFYQRKWQLGVFFFERLLPKIHGLVPSILAGSSSVMALDSELF